MQILIATLKSWNINAAYKLRDRYKGVHEITVIDENEKLLAAAEKTAPDYIFFPHWSYIIPAAIYENYNCVVFHMTDLPFGRGGSPLQNLIVRGFKETKISALRVVKELDAGPVYKKSPLSLDGSAEEIYRRCCDIIFSEMIPFIIENSPKPAEQYGEVTLFRRRTPAESELTKDMSLSRIYDHIRMLDAEGYPNAFIRIGKNRFYFTGADMTDGKLTARVLIEEDCDE